jgi:hypothetical protein
MKNGRQNKIVSKRGMLVDAHVECARIEPNRTTRKSLLHLDYVHCRCALPRSSVSCQFCIVRLGASLRKVVAKAKQNRPVASNISATTVHPANAAHCLAFSVVCFTVRVQANTVFMMRVVSCIRTTSCTWSQSEAFKEDKTWFTSVCIHSAYFQHMS